MEWRIGQDDSGLEIKEYIRRNISLSQRQLRRLKQEQNGILVNGKRENVRYVLHAGDCLNLPLDEVPEKALSPVPVPMPVEVLYEDRAVLVVNKPAGMPTHPSLHHYDDTLANALAYRAGQSGLPFVFHPITRLDSNTSGVLLTAKTQFFASRLSVFLQSERLSKCYLALACGQDDAPAGKPHLLESFLTRTGESIIRRRIARPGEPGADYALTAWTSLATKKTPEGPLTLLMAFPVTGRTHQLRVHFAAIGLPLLGDTLYGQASDLIGRQALHAYSLQFPHPEDERPMRVIAPPAPDFKAVLDLYFPDVPLPEPTLPSEGFLYDAIPDPSD